MLPKKIEFSSGLVAIWDRTEEHYNLSVSGWVELCFNKTSNNSWLPYIHPTTVDQLIEIDNRFAPFFEKVRETRNNHLDAIQKAFGEIMSVSVAVEQERI